MRIVTAVCGLILWAVLASPVVAVADTEAPPTREAFAEEVERLRGVAEALQAEAEGVKAEAIAAKRSALTAEAAMKAARESVRGLTEEYRAMWDAVRRLRLDGAGQAVVDEAVAKAKAIESENHWAKLRAMEAQASDAQTQMEEQGKQANVLEEKYREVLRSAKVAQGELRYAEGALANADRPGWFAKYTAKRAERIARAEVEAKKAREKEEAQARRAHEAAALLERFEAMTPAKRAEVVERLAEEVEALDAERSRLGEAREDKQAEMRAVSEKRRDVVSEMHKLRAQTRAAWSDYRELRRADGDQAAIDAAKIAAEKMQAEEAVKQEALQAEHDAMQEKVAQASVEATEIHDAFSKAGNDWAAKRRLWSDAKAAMSRAGQPVAIAEKGDGRAKRREQLREDWQLLTGKEVQWAVNPFKNQSVKTRGGIGRNGTLIFLTHDCEAYHSQMRIDDAGRSLLVLDGDGEVVFNGRVTELADRRMMSVDVYYLWEYLYERVSINGR